MPVIENSKITIPPNDSDTIWRFLNIPKFIDLIERGSLFFSNLSNFEDHWEGTKLPKSFDALYYQKIFKNNPGFFCLEGKEDDAVTLEIKLAKHTTKIWRNRIAANCWHLNPIEPEALWKIYSDKNFGIAIKSNVASLKESLSAEKRSLLISKMSYIDYFSESFEDNHVLSPSFYKRKSFEIENELRVITWTDEYNNPRKLPSNENGVYIKTDLDKLVNEIVLGPYVPEWFSESLNNYLKSRNIKLKLSHSIISSPCLF